MQVSNLLQCTSLISLSVVVIEPHIQICEFCGFNIFLRYTEVVWFNDNLHSCNLYIFVVKKLMYNHKYKSVCVVQ
jgi:hypothetical protein